MKPLHTFSHTFCIEPGPEGVERRVSSRSAFWREEDRRRREEE